MAVNSKWHAASQRAYTGNGNSHHQGEGIKRKGVKLVFPCKLPFRKLMPFTILIEIFLINIFINFFNSTTALKRLRFLIVMKRDILYMLLRILRKENGRISERNDQR